MPPIRQAGTEQKFKPGCKPLGRGREQNKSKNKNSPVCPLHGPGHDIKSCKVMLVQAKNVKSTWLNARRGGAGRVMFQGTNKGLDEAKSLMLLLPTH